MSSLAGGCFHGEDKDPLDKVIGFCFLCILGLFIYGIITSSVWDSPQEQQKTTSTQQPLGHNNNTHD